MWGKAGFPHMPSTTYQQWITLTTNTPRSTIPTGALTGAIIHGRIFPNVPELAGPLPKPVFHDPKHHLKIYQGDCLEILAAIPTDCVDLIFADPPYFLSNDGITCHAGKMVSVNKGAWDCTRGPDAKYCVLYRLGVRWIAIPGNRHVRDKIRQQLQVLRDLGFMEFLGGGRYRIA